MKELIGLVLPVGIDYINRYIASSKLRFLISLVVCTLVGLLVNFDRLNKPEELLGSIAIIFSEAQATYKLYWEKSALRAKIV